MTYIGIGSLSIVMLVGSAVGAVLAIQSYVGLERFGSTQFIGPIVFLAMVREFGPVFAAIMVIGRAGSAMTAEIGTMRITEQIDALQTLCIDVQQYLIIPRIVASTIILPILSIFCSLCGILAGYVVSVYLLGINGEVYQETIRTHAEMADIINGLIKAVIFGFLFSLISTYKGYITRGGAKGVGIATTQSVVFANVAIVVADYILASLMFTK
jgi:phospholipid/cholesterol/gamma-HCH transport system permease protein